jgi:putative colanic acid biosynthesis acetyltransferase WcaF
MSIKPLNANLKNPKNGGPSFTFYNRTIRFFWNLTWTILASWTPNSFWKWRIFLLKIFGAKLSNRCDVRGSARVWLPQNLQMAEGSIISENVICYNQAMISLGRSVIISQGAHLCSGSHDFEKSNFQLITKPIIINDNAWIAADVFVGPGAYIAEGVVLGARSVCFGNTKPWTVYIGNPCKAIKIRKH